MLEIKLQKYIFLQNMIISAATNVPWYDHFFSKLCVHFEPLLKWEYAHVYCNLKTEKEVVWGK